MTRRGLLLLIALASAGAVVVAAQTGMPEPAEAAPVVVKLAVHYDDDRDTRKSATLTCRASGNRATGYLRRRSVRKLCRAARALRRFLATQPRHEVCTEIYGGPDRAYVTGRIGSDRIDRRLARRNGCEIDDWDRAQPLLPRPRGAAAP